MTNRRGFLTLAGGVVAAAGLAGCGARAPWSSAARQGSTGTLLPSAVPLPPPFTVPLPVPELATPVDPSTYDISCRATDLEILPGRTTRALTYGGSFPGPTVGARVGQEATVRLRNDLDIATVLHLHGGVTPPEHDGWPTQYVQPGRTREYRYPLAQRAAPLWYHDHTLDFTGPNVYAGLAGMFLLHDPAEDELGLPTGERDLPLVICDRSFGPDAEFAYPAMDPSRAHGGVEKAYHGGVLGDCVLVNGAPWPVLEVAAARYRFRLLNASNARRFDLVLDSGAEFVQIGTDLGLLERPWRRSNLPLAGAERADVVIDFSRLRVGTRVTMTNRAARRGPGQVMQFVVARSAADDSRVPPQLSRIDPVDPARVVVTRNLHFALGPAYAGNSRGHDGPAGHAPLDRSMNARGLWSVAGITWADDKDVATMRLGTVERWRLSSDVHHPVHAHLVHLQVNDPRGGRMWKDTIDLRPGSAVEVLVPVEGYRGRYVLHCHNLEHEDMMMMVPFSVA